MRKSKKIFTNLDCDTIFITYNYDILLEYCLGCIETTKETDYIDSNGQVFCSKPLLGDEFNTAYTFMSPLESLCEFDKQQLIEKMDIPLHRYYVCGFKTMMPFEAFIERIQTHKLNNNFSLNTGYGFNIKPIFDHSVNSKNIHTSYPKSIKIFKMHGSINWRIRSDETRATIENVYLSPPYLEIPICDYDRYKDFLEKENIICSNQALIVPMTHSKSAFLDAPIFESIWRQAYQSLEQADEIIFIGCSFPETDINNLFFFQPFQNKITGICSKIDDDKEWAAFKKKVNRYYPNLQDNVFDSLDAVGYLSKFSSKV